MNIELGTLATLLNKSQEELTTALKDGDNWKDDAGKTLTSLFTEHLNTKLKEKSDEYQKSKVNLEKKGFKEGSEAMEAKMRELFSITDKIEGETLIETLNKEVETLRKGASTLTEDQVKASPIFANALKEQAAKLSKVTEEAKAETEKLRGEYAREKVMSKVLSEANSHFDSLDIIDTATPEVRKSWKELMELSITKSANFKIDESGQVVVTDEKGEPLQDPTGKLVALKDIIEKSTSHVLTKVSKDRSGGGGDGDDKNKKKASDWAKPKTRAEFVETVKKMRSSGLSENEINEWSKTFDYRSLPSK